MENTMLKNSKLFLKLIIIQPLFFSNYSCADQQQVITNQVQNSTLQSVTDDLGHALEIGALLANRLKQYYSQKGKWAKSMEDIMPLLNKEEKDKLKNVTKNVTIEHLGDGKYRVRGIVGPNYSTVINCNPEESSSKKKPRTRQTFTE